jgi:hypothetical protein
MVDITLTNLCQDLKNWFEDRDVKYIGQITLAENGDVFCNGVKIGLEEGEYYRVIKSKFSDGIHIYPDADTRPESFDGAVWPLRINPAFLQEAQQLGLWDSTTGKKLRGPYSSENLSASGYSYTMRSAYDIAKATLRSAFPEFFSRWGKI